MLCGEAAVWRCFHLLFTVIYRKWPRIGLGHGTVSFLTPTPGLGGPAVHSGRRLCLLPPPATGRYRLNTRPARAPRAPARARGRIDFIGLDF
jgi:hypothetical protein